MGGKQIRSGQEIINGFLVKMEADASMDRETIAAIRVLWQQNKLTPDRLQQELDKARQERLKHGQDKEG